MFARVITAEAQAEGFDGLVRLARQRLPGATYRKQDAPASGTPPPSPAQRPGGIIDLIIPRGCWTAAGDSEAPRTANSSGPPHSANNTAPEANRSATP